MSTPESLHYGTWTHDDAGLPCFDGRFGGAVAIDRPFLHGISSGRLQALVNRHGLVHLFTTEGGHTDLSANTFCGRSGLYLELEINGDRYSLIHDDLDESVSVRYGIGYARFTGIWRDGLGGALEVEQEFYVVPDREARAPWRAACACGRISNPTARAAPSRASSRAHRVPCTGATFTRGSVPASSSPNPISPPANRRASRSCWPRRCTCRRAPAAR